MEKQLDQIAAGRLMEQTVYTQEFTRDGTMDSFRSNLEKKFLERFGFKVEEGEEFEELLFRFTDEHIDKITGAFPEEKTIEAFSVWLDNPEQGGKLMEEVFDRFLDNATAMLSFYHVVYTKEDALEWLKDQKEVQKIVEIDNRPLTLEERLTQAMEIVGYEPINVQGFSDDFLMWKEIGKDESTRFGLDGWYGVADYLEGKNISDDRASEYENLIHPQNTVSYYTVNMNSEHDVTPHYHDNISEALNEYSSCYIDGKTVGFMINKDLEVPYRQDGIMLQFDASMNCDNVHDTFNYNNMTYNEREQIKAAFKELHKTLAEPKLANRMTATEVDNRQRDKETGLSLDLKQPMTVQEFLEKHQGVAFDIMTPGGYVYLTSEKAQLLLSGEDTKGHLGSKTYTVDIPNEELLTQMVIEANFNDGTWNVLSGYKQENEQEQPPSGISCNMKVAQGNNVFVLSEQGYLHRAAKGLNDIKPGQSFQEYKNKVPRSWAEKGWVKEVSPDEMQKIQQNQIARVEIPNNRQPIIELEP
jgi:hypothetical protein